MAKTSKKVCDEATPAPATDAAKETVRVRLATVVEFDMPLDTVTGYLDRAMANATTASPSLTAIPENIENRISAEPPVTSESV